MSITCFSIAIMAQSSGGSERVGQGVATGQGAAGSEIIAVTIRRSSQISWEPRVEDSGMVLTISAPDGRVFRRDFKAGETPSFDLTAVKGDPLPDGQYQYELRLVTTLAPEVKEALQRAREKGDSAETLARLRGKGAFPHRVTEQSGAFQVRGGTILTASSEGESGGSRTDTPEKDGEKPRDGGFKPQDAVTPDDVIIQGSACVGFDCVNNENFGFDTIRLKENNLRIKFEDTSVSPFPTTDWQLTANDSASGGANRFSIEDITLARVPFTITGGATTNSIFVSSTGRVGFRTSTPVLDLHVNTGDTPALRFEQNNTGGFTAQTWDVAGNEAGFFVRDVTAGSRLSFRILPGAASSSLVIAGNSNVGVGTLTPASALHITRNTGAFANILQLTNNSGVGFILNNTLGNSVFVSVNNAASAYTVNFDDGDGAEFSLDAAGNITGVTSCSGCSAPSSRHLKENFVPVDRSDTLKKLLKLDVFNWNYKNINPEQRHIGPVSQDFHALFNVGLDVTLNPVDTFGVTVAAIQALNGEVSDLRKLVAEQQAQIAELQKAIQRLSSK
jgi:hypothetical protein